MITIAKRIIILLALTTCLFGSAETSAAETQLIKEEALRIYFEDLFQADDPSEYGFTTADMDSITFADPRAIYRLNPHFAFGKSKEIFVPEADEWIALVYENKQAINGIRLKSQNDKSLTISGFGYPLELAPNLANLAKDEVLIEELAIGSYYAFHTMKQSIRELGNENQDSFSVEDFQTMLLERYQQEPTMNHQSVWLYSSLGLLVVIGTSFIIGRKRSRR